MAGFFIRPFFSIGKVFESGKPFKNRGISPDVSGRTPWVVLDH
jgi:hypothetical protein